MKLSCVIIAVAMCIAVPCLAQTKSKAPATEKSTSDRLIFGVSEGTSGSIDTSVAIEKYRPLANVMEKALGKRVVIVFVRNFDALETGIKSGEFDLVMARPSDYPARGVRDYGYSLVATSKPDGQCLFIVEKSSPLKKIEDMKGRTIIFPEKVAYMSKFCTAELRDKGINVAEEKITYAREQGAVAWSVENKLVDVGAIASYSGAAKTWEKSGQRILHKTAGRPYSPLIAGSRIPPGKQANLKAVLADLEQTDDGKKVLDKIGIKGFNPESPERLLALLTWLERP
jgi:phosphonate transport system substrate-binding protein